jgi:uncharacterized membrane protein
VARAEREGERGATREQQRLNTPGRRTRSVLPSVRWDRDAFGKFAESFARFMGTAKFLIGMTVIIIIWVLWNVPFGPARPRFDEYPFIFLTLVLSLQASYAAPLILLAQNRTEARDRVALEADREQTAQSRADMDFLAREIAGLRMSVGELATRDFLRGELRSELRAIMDELDDDENEDGDLTKPDRRPSSNGSSRRESALRESNRRSDGARSR